jgi:hypothetical protein
VHPEKDGNWDIRIEEVVRAGQSEVCQPERIRRHHRGHRHRRHAEEQLTRQGDEEEETRIMCGGKNCVTAMSWPQVMPDVPVTRSAREKTVSEKAEGLKMCAWRPSLSQPDQAFGDEPDGEHQELQEEPVRPEPDETGSC